MENKDEKLWQSAKNRVRFKGKVMTYIVFSIFFWIVWFFSGRNSYGTIPWPAWAMLGWGFGLFMQYIRIYHSNSEDEVQKEYDKMKGK